MVRVELHGRRVGGWVVDGRRRAAATGVDLRPLAKVTGWGPPRRPRRPGRLGGVALGRPAGHVPAHRVAARRRSRALPDRRRRRPAGRRRRTTRSLADALRPTAGVLRLPPGADRYPLVLAAAADRRRRRAGAVPVGRPRPGGWPAGCAATGHAGGLPRPRPARCGGGGRVGPGGRRRGDGGRGPGRRRGRRCPGSAGWSCSTSTTRRYQAEQAPDLARPRRRLRAGRAGRRAVPAGVAVPDARGARLGRRCSPRAGPSERRGWPAVEVVDRRHEDPAKGGLFSDRLRRPRCGRPGRVVCVAQPRSAGPGCWPARRAASWAAASVCGAAVEQLEDGRAPLPAVRHRAAGRLHRAAGRPGSATCGSA